MIRPLRGFVLIEPEQAEDVSAGGIILPQDSQEKPAKGTIISIGNPTFEQLGKADAAGLEVLDVKKGDVVYYKKWAADEVTEGDKQYKFVKFDDLMGVVE